MADFGDYKNNPLWTDITHLDHLSPSPSFGYQWNKESGRWEPDQTNYFLHGISGLIGVSNEWLEGISGVLSSDIKIGVDLDHDTETHRLLSGVSGQLKNVGGSVGITGDVSLSDTETHRLLSGVSGELSNLEIQGGNVSVTGGSRDVQQPWKLRTKTVDQYIDEDMILLESVPDELRYGTPSGTCYGTDISVMDDVYGTYFANARRNPSMLETGHGDYLIHAEYIDPDRCIQQVDVFHSDTKFSMRLENSGATNINSYPLEDYNSLYERGLAESITIFNESPYPLQFHTADRRYDPYTEPVISETEDLIYLDSDMAVNIKNDEAGRLYVKRPHTLSGYNVKYAVTYKVTGGNSDVIE